MKILLTGSTANQSNPITHSRSTNFAGLIYDSFRHNGVDVTWEDPSLSLRRSDFDQYDKVVVGISSPMALGANRVYGALNIVSVLWNDPRLALLLDAPDPNNISRGLNSINRNPSSLTKPFFAYRKDYELAASHMGKAQTLAACELLRNSEWPTTLVPAFPWSTVEQFERDLPEGAFGKVRPMNLDNNVVRRFEKMRPENPEREARWMAERGADKNWLKSLELNNPVLSLRADHRTDIHPYLLSRLNTATGFLHSPSKRGVVWWTPKVALALSQRTPVFTQWKGRTFDSAFSIKPKTFEVLSAEEQQELAQHQYDVYMNSIPNGGQVGMNTFKSLDLEIPE